MPARGNALGRRVSLVVLMVSWSAVALAVGMVEQVDVFSRLLFMLAVTGLASLFFSGLSRRLWFDDLAVRITHIGACFLRNGQLALRPMGLRVHPLCAILTLRSHDPQLSQRGLSLIFWRHHYQTDQYRKLMLVLRWLVRGAKA